MPEYYPPQFEAKKFHCALCQVYAAQGWGSLVFGGGGGLSGFKYSACAHCSKMCFWFEKRMIIPSAAPVPVHHEDLPSECIPEYDEARDIVGRSPRAAAALMRLCIQKLLASLGCKGKNINDDIGTLVSQGLPVEVQQALDYCRVIGNNAVHPGEVRIEDDDDIAFSLFEMVNFVVEDRIARPRRISNLYSVLPAGALNAIKERDTPQSPN